MLFSSHYSTQKLDLPIEMEKTIIELSDITFEKAEIVAANRGVTFSQLISELQEELVATNETKESDKPRMLGFGELADLANENRRILKIIEDKFGVIDKRDTKCF